MSLDWNVTGVANHEEVCFDYDKDGNRSLSPVTEAIIFLTMGCDIGWGVTEKNVEEFVARAALWQAVNGPMIHEWDEETQTHRQRTITADEIRAHVGLRTNVAYGPRDAWLLRVFGGRWHFPEPEPDCISWEVLFEWYDDERVVEVTAKDQEAAIAKAKAQLVGDPANAHFELGRAAVYAQKVGSA